MALYRYVKSQSYTTPLFRFPIIVSFFLIVIGSSILFWVGWPIISFSLFSQYLFAVTVSPLSEIDLSRTTALSPIVLAATNTSSEDVRGLTNANLWFPTLPQKKVVTPVNSYKLSIPKLSITDASVLIAGDDLKKSLIHYGGTALPGEYGTSVIFGHSTLPQFFNPKDYTTIFSTLPTMKVGDDVFITYDGITFQYKVFEMIVLDPTDLSELEQRFDDSYVTLVTCVPPGTYWKRLYVKARLVRPIR